MTRHLHPVDREQHSVKVPAGLPSIGELEVMEHLAAVVLPGCRETHAELFDALERRDRALIIACLRKLTSIGWLANEDALKLESR